MADDSARVARPDEHAAPAESAERTELDWLRAENALLRTQRDVLRRVAAGFAEDADATLLRRKAAPVRTTTRGHTMTDTTDRVWLTADAHDRLSRELAELREGYERAESGTASADGAALDDGERALEGRRLQVRIRRIEEILHRARVGEAPPDDGVAEPGMVLTVRFDDDPEPERFLLGVRDGWTADGMEICSPESPLGRAIGGAREGEQRTYVVPNGATVAVTLVRAVPYDGP